MCLDRGSGEDSGCSHLFDIEAWIITDRLKSNLNAVVASTNLALGNRPFLSHYPCHPCENQSRPFSSNTLLEYLCWTLQSRLAPATMDRSSTIVGDDQDSTVVGEAKDEPIISRNDRIRKLNEIDMVESQFVLLRLVKLTRIEEHCCATQACWYCRQGNDA